MKHSVAVMKLRTFASWEHREGQTGKLIFRTMTIEVPRWPACNCLGLYLWALIQYALLIRYHKARHIYVYKHRNNNIPEKYRTGDPAPTSVGEILREIAKLKLRR